MNPSQQHGQSTYPQQPHLPNGGSSAPGPHSFGHPMPMPVSTPVCPAPQVGHTYSPAGSSVVHHGYPQPAHPQLGHPQPGSIIIYVNYPTQSCHCAHSLLQPIAAQGNPIASNTTKPTLTAQVPFPNGGSLPKAPIAPGMPKFKPTLVSVKPFEPRKDAEVLSKAMKGFSADEKAIVQVLSKRSLEQRLQIGVEFKNIFGKDLVSELKSKTSGKLEDALVAMMTPLPQFYAKELHDAMAGLGTDEDILIEVMCTMSNKEIKAIKQAYAALYSKQLEEDLGGDTSGNFNALMIGLCAGIRSEDFHVDRNHARKDAESLLKAGEKRLGTDEALFNSIFCSRSFPHLAAIFQEYQTLTGHDIDEAIKTEFSGDMLKALSAIVKVVRNKPLVFAEGLHKSMKGLGTNDKQLIRIMVTRCEVDLGDISDQFQFKYGKSLHSWIEGDTSGNYRKCLLGLLGLLK